MTSKKDPGRTSKPKNSKSGTRLRKCVGCGKTLPENVRYCVSCGAHDEVELDSRVADLDRQIQRSHERNFFHLWLSRLLFGFWRS